MRQNLFIIAFIVLALPLAASAMGSRKIEKVDGAYHVIKSEECIDHTCVVNPLATSHDFKFELKENANQKPELCFDGPESSLKTCYSNFRTETHTGDFVQKDVGIFTLSSHGFEYELNHEEDYIDPTSNAKSSARSSFNEQTHFYRGSDSYVIEFVSNVDGVRLKKTYWLEKVQSAGALETSLSQNSL